MSGRYQADGPMAGGQGRRGDSGRREPPPDGFVLVDKPLGWTSHQVVGRLRRHLGSRKIGHAGTLDPLATGLLVCGVGRATRLLGYIQGEAKTYQARLRFGVETTTEDQAGEVTAARGAATLTPEAIQQASLGFLGDIEQVPSAVSAVKVSGQRAYVLARRGETPQLKARTVRISRLEWGQARMAASRPVVGTVLGTPEAQAAGAGPLVPVVDVDLWVDCSAGTYIRALARDLGHALGTGACLIGLRRLRSGAFDVSEARVGLTTLENGHVAAPLPIAPVMGRVLPVVQLAESQISQVSYGQPVNLTLTGPSLLVGSSGQALAVYGPAGDAARPLTVLVGGTA